MIAHAGGWDELLMGVLPVLVFLVVYRVIRGRGDDAGSDSRDAGSEPREGARR